MFEKRLSPAQEANLLIIGEKFPRIADMIRASWGSEEGKDYLESLLIDNRGGRAGFPFDVISALMELQAEHKLSLKAPITKKKKDPWEDLRGKK